MGAFIIRRFLWMLLVLFAVSIVTFLLMHGVPGGPFDGDKKLPPEIIENINAKYNLNQPLYMQYLRYMGDIVVPRIYTGEIAASQTTDYLIDISLGIDTHFQWVNFGPSFKSKSRTVNDIFRDQLPVSAQLGIIAILISMSIGIPLGMIAALNHNRSLDYAAMGVAILGVSVPSIILGPFLVWIFGVNGVAGIKLPVTGWGTPQAAIMPSLALGFASSALIARLTRASLLEVLHDDYIRTARAKGLAEKTVLGVHALKNAMIPVVTIIGPLFAALVTGTFVVETIFGIPGMGKYFIDSITNRDYPVIMGTTLLYAALLVIANLFVDLAYGWLDPRIRYS